MNNPIKSINTCEECNSDYYTGTSQMENLCPECAHILYGYKNCSHSFKNERCLKCYWNGNVSDYIKKLKDLTLNKTK